MSTNRATLSPLGSSPHQHGGLAVGLLTDGGFGCGGQQSDRTWGGQRVSLPPSLTQLVHDTDIEQVEEKLDAWRLARALLAIQLSARNPLDVSLPIHCLPCFRPEE